MQSPGSRKYYVHIMASWSRALYIGMTNNLERGVRQHKDGQGATFQPNIAFIARSILKQRTMCTLPLTTKSTSKAGDAHEK